VVLYGAKQSLASNNQELHFNSFVFLLSI